MTETITYGPAGPASMTFQHVRICPASFQDTAAALRETIRAADFVILAEVDSQAALGKAGITIPPTLQILFFRPRILADVLAIDQAALLEAPLKLVVMERPGGAVLIRWHDPAMAFARYGHGPLATLGRQLAAACEAIADTAIRSLIEGRPASANEPRAPAVRPMAEATP